MRRGFYVIPSLFTVANIFCGFLSIIASSRGQFERSAVLILVAIFADVLDGRIARLTGTATRFGEEFDSLADVVSFGVAPALLAFQWGLWEVPRVGMAVAFLFLVAGSIRLARFSSSQHDSLDFIGLPIPAGAGSIAMLVLLSPTPVTYPAFIPVVVAFYPGGGGIRFRPFPADGLESPVPLVQRGQPAQEMAGADPLPHRARLLPRDSHTSRPIGPGRDLYPLRADHGSHKKGAAPSFST